MRKFLVFLLILGAGWGLYLALGSKPEYVNFPPSAGKSWVAFGDSLTSGYGASDGNDYPALLGRRLGINILNFGTPGATTQDALAKVDDVLKAQPKVILLCLGGNDTLNAMPHSQTFGNLETMIDQFQQTGAFVVLIGIRTASVRDKYSSEFKSLARKKRVMLVPNILHGVLGNPELMSDYVHPNDQGYAAIADRLEKVLAPLLPQLMPN